MAKRGAFRRVLNRIEGPYRVMLALYAALLIVAFVFDTPYDIWHGLLRILTSRSLLVTDYAAIGGVGAMLVSSVIVGVFSMTTLILGGVKANGGTLMGLWLILGFGFFGKNLFNTIPLTLGVFAFAKYKRMPFRDVAVTTMMCASVSPIVSEVAYLAGFPSLMSILAGGAIGVFIGFIFAPLGAAMNKVHGGYLLYNAGFVGGIIATFAVSLLRSAGFDIVTMNIWSTDYTLPLSIMMYLISATFIVLGLIKGGQGQWRKMRKINSHSGRLVTDFYELYGDVTYLNMGILCALATTVVLVVGGAINGATMGGIFCIVGFGALGKNLRNVVPIIIGAVISAFWNDSPITSPSNMLAILFGTGIAPLAGQFGIFWGIVAGFIHVNIASFVGLLNGGLNLYNNGFAGGFVVIFMVPIIVALRRNRVNVRVSKLKDVDDISSILACSHKSAYRGIVHDDYLDALKDDHWVDFLMDGLCEDSIFCMVAEHNHEIVGAAILGKGDSNHEVTLTSMYLHPDKIGKKIGSAFYAAIETELKDRGFLNCTMVVLENNARAIRFFEARGFLETGKEIRTDMGKRKYTSKVFEKPL
ncbi:MAG: GNAT family N-acetyltransferase [Oscillospiraceae bacterium]|nr:GNAT family N-acetyltransferase [Oscillospiraceae bacterium]